MYEKLVKDLEHLITNTSNRDIDEYGKLLDLIIKIKTIQALDVSAELIKESRKVSIN